MLQYLYYSLQTLALGYSPTNSRYPHVYVLYMLVWSLGIGVSHWLAILCFLKKLPLSPKSHLFPSWIGVGHWLAVLCFSQASPEHQCHLFPSYYTWISMLVMYSTKWLCIYVYHMSRLMFRMVDSEMLWCWRNAWMLIGLCCCRNASMLALESYDMLSWCVSSSPPMVPY